MAHRGHQIISLINKVAALINYYGNRNANEPLNPYMHEGCVEIITEEIKELNNYSFFDYDTPLHIVRSYEDKVSIMLSKLYDINDFEELLTEFRWMYFHIQSERCQIDNLQHKETNQSTPEIPTPALISFCKESEYGSKEDIAKNLCDRFSGKRRNPGEVIEYWFQIGCNIKSSTHIPEKFIKEILIENKLIEPPCGEGTIRKAIKRNS